MGEALVIPEDATEAEPALLEAKETAEKQQHQPPQPQQPLEVTEVKREQLQTSNINYNLLSSVSDDIITVLSGYNENESIGNIEIIFGDYTDEIDISVGGDGDIEGPPLTGPAGILENYIRLATSCNQGTGYYTLTFNKYSTTEHGYHIIFGKTSGENSASMKLRYNKSHIINNYDSFSIADYKPATTGRFSTPATPETFGEDIGYDLINESISGQFDSYYSINETNPGLKELTFEYDYFPTGLYVTFKIKEPQPEPEPEPEPELNPEPEHELNFAWSSCPNVEVPERIAYDSIDYDVSTGELSLSGVDVGFFKLIRKIVIYAAKIEAEKPMVVDKTIIKITPGTSKFPLKSAPMNFGEANIIRVKLIGNRIAEGSKSTNGVRAHPIWECIERTISA